MKCKVFVWSSNQTESDFGKRTGHLECTKARDSSVMFLYGGRVRLSQTWAGQRRTSSAPELAQKTNSGSTRGLCFKLDCECCISRSGFNTASTHSCQTWSDMKAKSQKGSERKRNNIQQVLGPSVKHFLVSCFRPATGKPKTDCCATFVCQPSTST